MHDELYSWLQYDIFYGLRDEEKCYSLEKLIDNDTPYRFLEENMSNFQQLEVLMQSLLTNEMACRTEQLLQPSTSKHIGIFVVEFSDFV